MKSNTTRYFNWQEYKLFTFFSDGMYLRFILKKIILIFECLTFNTHGHQKKKVSQMKKPPPQF